MRKDTRYLFHAVRNERSFATTSGTPPRDVYGIQRVTVVYYYIQLYIREKIAAIAVWSVNWNYLWTGRRKEKATDDNVTQTVDAIQRSLDEREVFYPLEVR